MPLTYFKYDCFKKQKKSLLTPTSNQVASFCRDQWQTLAALKSLKITRAARMRPTDMGQGSSAQPASGKWKGT